MASYSQSPFDSVLDVLLADTAIRLQLSPSQHRNAEARYNSIAKWADRHDSCLFGKIALVYTQGGMAIGATIASAANNDEFDIDLVAQLALSPDIPPSDALDLMFRAIRGEPGSRYFDMTTRNTRCVTVKYADMHLDVTPAVLLPRGLPRTSVIFHSKPEEPRSLDHHIVANPYGFANWFNDRTPPDELFAEYYARRSTEWDSKRNSRAEAEDVPAQSPTHRKSVAVVALQLLKRYRNLAYDSRDERAPPSVLLAKIVGDSTSGGNRLSDELAYQADKLLRRLEACCARDALIHEANPACEEDILTDRWPNCISDQELFVADLHHLLRQLQRLNSGASLEVMREVLGDLFGEIPARDVFNRFNDQIGHGVDKRVAAHQPRTGRIELASVLPAAPSVHVKADSRTSRAHTFYGELNVSAADD